MSGHAERRRGAGWKPALGLAALLAAPHTGLACAGPDWEAQLQAAEGLAREGEIAAALACYRALAESRPDAAPVHARIGGMLLLEQEYTAAIRSFQTAIGLAPDSGREAFIGLGIAYLHLGQYGPARAALEQARSLRPDAAAEIDQLVAWLDGQESRPQAGRH